MGELLVKGWKMLADSCPKCNCQYMQSKKGVKVCCGCNQDKADQPPKTETPAPAPK